ncbi:MAG: beta-galactosidase, partial [Polyangiaceae bacterium]
LREAWSDREINFAGATPPEKFDAKTADDLVKHLDWMEFHEHLLAYGIGSMAKMLEASGFDGLPTMHNFPLGESATPLNAARIEVDLVALDYYHGANPRDHMTMMRRTSELAARSAGVDVPPYAAEMGAGFPPFFAPLGEDDSLYTIMTALAYGLRGFNLYMAVERDRWIGAPIDPRGHPRPLGEKLRALFDALEKAAFHTLSRRTPVRLVIPRALRRLARATHAFGPLTPAAFHVMGGGFRESCLEDDFDGGEEPAPLAGEAYVRAFERALLRRGVPFAYAAGETFEESIAGAKWIVCATAGGVKRELISDLRSASRRGIKVTIGPRIPDRDGNFRKLASAYDAKGLEIEPLSDVSRADALVAKRIEDLDLPTFACDPADVFVAVHDDASGAPRVVFVMNPTAEARDAHIAIPGVASLSDAISSDDGAIIWETGGARVPIRPRSVRMLMVVADAPLSHSKSILA